MTDKKSNRCPHCGFRVRGKSHDKGTHHLTQNRAKNRQGKKTRK